MSEGTFEWTPELIAEEAARMDAGIALLSEHVWSHEARKWVPAK